MTKRVAEPPPGGASDRPAPFEGAETSDAILRFMESIGHRSEAEFYLALFRAEKKESFANLVIEASVLRDAAEAVVLDLRFLSGLGLTPVVSLGLGPLLLGEVIGPALLIGVALTLAGVFLASRS